MAKKKDQATSDGMKEAIQLLMSKNEELKDQLRVAHYTTVDQFLEEYTGALREHLEAQYSYKRDPRALMHPEDLASAAATFSDVWWAIAQHTDYRRRGSGWSNLD